MSVCSAPPRSTRAGRLAFGLLLCAPAAGCYEPSKDTAPPYRLEDDTGQTGGDGGTVDSGTDPDAVPSGMVATVGDVAFTSEVLTARVDAGYLFIEGISADDVGILIDAVDGQLGVQPLTSANPFAALTPGAGADACVAGTNGAPEGEIDILRINSTEVVAEFSFGAGCADGAVAVVGTVRTAL
ncbi:MAG: hypothetical protein JNM72_18815 [Deltaproteobacteria bacterium]|nr:hypothetical protein [Deltaproteobacteria bacterium]